MEDKSKAIHLNIEDLKAKKVKKMTKPKLSELSIERFEGYCSKIQQYLDTNDFKHWIAHNYWIITKEPLVTLEYIKDLAKRQNKTVYEKGLTKCWDRYKGEEYIVLCLPKRTNKKYLLKRWLENITYLNGETRRGCVKINENRKLFILASDIPENIITFVKMVEKIKK